MAGVASPEHGPHGPPPPELTSFFAVGLVESGAAESEAIGGGGGGVGGSHKPACIHGADQVRTPVGLKRIDMLKIGDPVTNGEWKGHDFVYEPIIAFLHRDTSNNAIGYRFLTSGGRTVSISDEHLIFLAPDRKAVLAKHVQLGQVVYTMGNGSVHSTELDSVVKIERSSLLGRYSPLTKSGTLLVNDILVSCYSHVEDHDLMHRVVHWLLPFTRFEMIFGSEAFGDGLDTVGGALWHFFRHYFCFK